MEVHLSAQARHTTKSDKCTCDSLWEQSQHRTHVVLEHSHREKEKRREKLEESETKRAASRSPMIVSLPSKLLLLSSLTLTITMCLNVCMCLNLSRTVMCHWEYHLTRWRGNQRYLNLALTHSSLGFGPYVYLFPFLSLSLFLFLLLSMF